VVGGTDTLQGIAIKFDMTVQELTSTANRIPNKQIFPGQKLYVKDIPGVPAQSAAPEDGAADKEKQPHFVSGILSDGTLVDDPEIKKITDQILAAPPSGELFKEPDPNAVPGMYHLYSLSVTFYSSFFKENWKFQLIFFSFFFFFREAEGQEKPAETQQQDGDQKTEPKADQKGDGPGGKASFLDNLTQATSKLTSQLTSQLTNALSTPFFAENNGSDANLSASQLTDQPHPSPPMSESPLLSNPLRRKSSVNHHAQSSPQLGPLPAPGPPSSSTDETDFHLPSQDDPYADEVPTLQERSWLRVANGTVQGTLYTYPSYIFFEPRPDDSWIVARGLQSASLKIYLKNVLEAKHVIEMDDDPSTMTAPEIPSKVPLSSLRIRIFREGFLWGGSEKTVDFMVDNER